MATYPGGVYSPRTKENRSGVVYDALKTKNIYAEDVKKLDDEVVAIETLIGTSPLSIFASIKDYLGSLYLLGTDFFGSTAFSSPADSTTYYGGVTGWAGGTSQAFYNFKFLGTRGYISDVNLRIGRSGTVPSDESVSFYIRVNTTDYLIADNVNLSVSSLQGREINNQEILIEKGDDICIKMVTPAWATNPGTIVLQHFIHIKALPVGGL